MTPLRPEPAPQPGTSAAASASTPHLRHYVWLGEAALTGDELAEIFAWAADRNAIAGADLAEAIQADVVTLVGDPETTRPMRLRFEARGIDVLAYASTPL